MASVSIRCPSWLGIDGVVCKGKSIGGSQGYVCSDCRKKWEMR
ncbi:IS1 family transposase, partial [Escherichia coli]|nr:IS1 family transposase [Escherichia coli]